MFQPCLIHQLGPPSAAKKSSSAASSLVGRVIAGAGPARDAISASQSQRAAVFERVLRAMREACHGYRAAILAADAERTAVGPGACVVWHRAVATLREDVSPTSATVG